MNLTPITSNLYSPLTSNITRMFDSETVRAADDESPEAAVRSTFADMLATAFDNAEATDAVDKTSSAELLIGQTDDLSGLMLDTSKAELALSLALQLRNKVVDAYNDIIRMQV